MTDSLYVEYVVKINRKLLKGKWKEGKKEIAKVLENYLADPIKCSKNTSEKYVNGLRHLISGYMYCLSKEKNEGCIILDHSILQAITLYKAFKKQFEKYNAKTQKWVDIYCGLSIVCQKIYLSQMNEFDLNADKYEEGKNRADLKELLRKKQSLERMTDVTNLWGKILNDLNRIRIPQNSLCIEFVCYFNYQMILENFLERDSIKVSILLHEQKQGRFYSRWIGELQDYGKIIDYISELTDSYSRSQETRDRDLLKRLSDKLLKLIWPYLNSVEQILWIPDGIFFYLPMELLFCPDKDKQLLDIYQHVYLDSLLDCREETQIDVKHTKAFVMGALAYAVPVRGYNETEVQKTEERIAKIPITELVNSRQECKIIGKFFRTVPLIGEEAHKSSFFENCESSEIIHLSTHGNIFNSTLFDKFPSTGMFLVMAGYKNWCAGNYEVSCGNGCLTAQEIAMTDLRNVKLVVISSCKSAVSLYEDGEGLVSIRSAFEEAGAEQTIAALWEVEDRATAILMVLFYRYLHSAVPSVALNKAKQKLRSLDYQEIRNDRDLYSIWQESGEDTLSDHQRPFAAERYWAAFICHINGVQ